MKIKDIALSAAYVGQRVVKAICVGAQEVWSAVKYIVFKDKVVEQICATNWGDGTGITEEQAAKVTDIGTIFNGNTEISSFDELRYFSGLTSIPLKAFMNSSITSVIIPPNTTSILNDAFQACHSLTRVEIPSNVTTIADGCFMYSEQLREVVIPKDSKITKFGISSFHGCSSLIALKIPNGVTSIPSSLCYQCSSLIEISFPEGVTTIGRYSFDSCDSLASVTIPTSVTIINERAFNQCPNIQSTHISSLESWLRITFGIASTPLKPGTSLYLNGELLTEVIVPSAITSIKNDVFDGYRLLKKVEIHENVTNIGDAAFRGCVNMNYIICRPTTPPTLGIVVLDGYNCPIYVPDQSVTAYREASRWSAYASRIKPLSEHVES